MDPNQGTGYGARVGRILQDGTVKMIETQPKPPWKWSVFQGLGRRTPKLKVYMIHGNHRFQGVLRDAIHHGSVPNLPCSIVSVFALCFAALAHLSPVLGAYRSGSPILDCFLN